MLIDFQNNKVTILMLCTEIMLNFGPQLAVMLLFQVRASRNGIFATNIGKCQKMSFKTKNT